MVTQLSLFDQAVVDEVRALAIPQRPQPSKEVSDDASSIPPPPEYVKPLPLTERYEKAVAILDGLGNSDPTKEELEALIAYPGKGKILGNQTGGIGQYFTPPYIAHYMTVMASPSEKARLLDNSAGIGNLLAPVLDAQEHIDPRRFTIIEVDPICARIIELRWPDVWVTAESATELRLRADHDVALLNPPFGLHFSGQMVKDMQTTSDGDKTLSHAYLLEQAIRAVKPAGVVVAILPTSFFDNTRPAEVRLRRWLARNTIFVQRTDLPQDAFIAAGTQWPTSIVLLQRRQEELRKAPAFSPQRTASVGHLPWSLHRDGASLHTVTGQLLASPEFAAIHRRQVSYRKSLYQEYWSTPVQRRQWPAPYLPQRYRAPAVKRAALERRTRDDYIAGHYWPGASLDTESTDHRVRVYLTSKGIGVRTYSAVATLRVADAVMKYLELVPDDYEHRAGDDALSRASLVQNGGLALILFEERMAELGIEVEWDESLLGFIQKRRRWLEARIQPREIAPPEGFARWSVVPQAARLPHEERVPPRLQHQYKMAAREIEAAIAHLMENGLEHDLWDYQRHGATVALMSLGKHGGFLLGDEPGVGKTLQAATVIRAMLDRSGKEHPRVIILCMSRLIDRVWIPALRDAGLPSVALVRGRRVCARCGEEQTKPVGSRCRCGGQVIPDAYHKRVREAEIHLVPYEALSSRRSKPYLFQVLRRLYRHEYVLGVADESTNLKNENSQRTQAVLGLRVPRWMLLSADADENGTQDLHSQFRLVFDPIVLQRPGLATSEEWIEEHAHTVVLRNGAVIIQPGILQLDTLRDTLHACMLRRQINDSEIQENKPIPTPNFQVVDLEQDRRERAFYMVLHRERAAQTGLAHLAARKKRGVWCDDDAVRFGKEEEGLSDVGRITDLRQSATCPWLWPEELWPYGFDTTKIRWLKQEIHRRQGQKGVIISSHRGGVAGIYLALREEFGRSAVEYVIGGQIKRTDKTLERFVSDPSLSIIVSSAQALNYGINDLTAAHYMIIVDRLWSPGKERQLFGRLVRKGQEKQVDIIWLSLLGTCDEHMDMTMYWKAVEGAQRKDRGFFSPHLIVWRDVLARRPNLDSDDIAALLDVGTTARPYDIRDFLMKVTDDRATDYYKRQLDELVEAIKIARNARQWNEVEDLERRHDAILQDIRDQAVRAAKQHGQKLQELSLREQAIFERMRRRNKR